MNDKVLLKADYMDLRGEDKIKLNIVNNKKNYSIYLLVLAWDQLLLLFL